jgi:hypothetical protein
MTFPLSALLWGAPLLMLLGGYLLMRCIAQLRRLILPKVRHRWMDATKQEMVPLPSAERYVIHIVFPPATFITGTAYFAAEFTIVCCATGQPVPYQAFSRFNLFNVQRTDMRGNTSRPLGEFHCSEAGNYQIICLTPDRIHPRFQLEVSPFISPVLFVALILGTLLSAAMTMGGLVLTIIKVSTLTT